MTVHRATRIEITRWVPHPLLSTPLACPLRDVTRGCRQCSQGTIGGSRLQGLGWHTAGEDRSGITGMTSPPFNRSPSSIRSGMGRGGGRIDGGEGGRRNGTRATEGKARRGCGGVRPQQVSGFNSNQNQASRAQFNTKTALK